MSVLFSQWQFPSFRYILRINFSPHIQNFCDVVLGALFVHEQIKILRHFIFPDIKTGIRFASFLLNV